MHQDQRIATGMVKAPEHRASRPRRTITPHPRPTYPTHRPSIPVRSTIDGDGEHRQGEHRHHDRADQGVVQRRRVAQHVDPGQRLVLDLDQVPDHAAQSGRHQQGRGEGAGHRPGERGRLHLAGPAGQREHVVDHDGEQHRRAHREEQRDQSRLDVRAHLPPGEQLGVAGGVRHVDAGHGQEEARCRTGPRTTAAVRAAEVRCMEGSCQRDCRDQQPRREHRSPPRSAHPSWDQGCP